MATLMQSWRWTWRSALAFAVVIFISNPCALAAAAMHDFDGNGYVGTADHEFFAVCLTLSGPNGNPGFQECRTIFDGDQDGDVDLADFAAFQRARGHLPIP